MSPRDRGLARRRLAARVRSVPGVRWGTARVLPRLRESELFVEVLTRALGSPGDLAGGRRPLRAPADLGPAPAGLAVDQLPVVLAVAVDVPADRLGSVLAQVGDLQRQTRAFRLVLLLGAGDPAAARGLGCPWELLPADAGEAGLARRILAMTDQYHAITTWWLSAAGVGSRDRALAAALPGWLEDRAAIDRAAVDRAQLR